MVSRNTIETTILKTEQILSEIENLFVWGTQGQIYIVSLRVELNFWNLSPANEFTLRIWGIKLCMKVYTEAPRLEIRKVSYEAVSHKACVHGVSTHREAT